MPRDLFRFSDRLGPSLAVESQCAEFKVIAHCKNLNALFYLYNFERQKLSVGPIFNNTFLATKLLQLAQIYRLIIKQGS